MASLVILLLLTVAVSQSIHEPFYIHHTPIDEDAPFEAAKIWTGGVVHEPRDVLRRTRRDAAVAVFAIALAGSLHLLMRFSRYRRGTSKLFACGLLMVAALSVGATYEAIYMADVLWLGGPLFLTYSAGFVAVAGFVCFLVTFPFVRVRPVDLSNVDGVLLIDPKTEDTFMQFLRDEVGLPVASRIPIRFGLGLSPEMQYFQGKINTQGQQWTGGLLVIPISLARVCSPAEFAELIRMVLPASPGRTDLWEDREALDLWRLRVDKAATVLPALSKIGALFVLPVLTHLQARIEHEIGASQMNAVSVSSDQNSRLESERHAIAKATIAQFAWRSFYRRIVPGFHSRAEDWVENLSLSFVHELQSADFDSSEGFDNQEWQAFVATCLEGGWDSVNDLKRLSWTPQQSAVDLLENPVAVELELTARVRRQYLLT